MSAHLCKAVLPSVRGLDFGDDLLPVDSGHGVFVVANVALWWVKVLAPSLSHNFEAIDFGFVVVNLGREDDGLGVVFQKVVWEGCAEERAIDVD